MGILHKIYRVCRKRLSIARDVAAGMKSLYAHGMQHRHLSSKTILLTSHLQAKVGRFCMLYPVLCSIYNAVRGYEVLAVKCFLYNTLHIK